MLLTTQFNKESYTLSLQYIQLLIHERTRQKSIKPSNLYGISALNGIDIYCNYNISWANAHRNSS